MRSPKRIFDLRFDPPAEPDRVGPGSTGLGPLFPGFQEHQTPAGRPFYGAGPRNYLVILRSFCRCTYQNVTNLQPYSLI